MLQYLLDKGETPVVAQGIVNRLAKESSFNPLEIGDNGTSFGLAQWHNERAVGLFNYGKATGRSPADWRMQLDYMRHEMETTESPTRERLKQATTPQEAEQIFTASFERPAATPRQLQQNTRGTFNGGPQTFVDGLLDNLRRANDRYDAQIRAAQEPRELERLLVAKYLNESQAPPQNMHQA